MKTCKDCVFYRPDFLYGVGFDGCTRKHTSILVPDIVRGGTNTVNTTALSDYRLCVDERASILPWNCGVKGRHHAPKVPA